MKGELCQLFPMFKILWQLRAQFPGSRTVRTGVFGGICKVECILTIMSRLSLNGGHAIVTWEEFAATNPERAFESPAIVTYTR